MAFVLSISGSTVLSESEQLKELFRWHTQAVEIGDLTSPNDLTTVIENCRRFGIQLGIHTPLFSIDDRRGLLWPDSPAWEELQRNLDMARRENLSYVLVHFPYVWDKQGSHLGVDQFRTIIPQLKRLERSSGIPIVCEPKLGPRRDPSAFTALWAISAQELLHWDLSFCLDVGDIFLASRVLHSSYEGMVSHLAPWCHVVHLHQVWFGGQRYFWTPVGENGPVPILRTLEILGGAGSDIFAVLEHTPHRVRDTAEVEEGINWLLRNSGQWRDREGLPPVYDGKYRGIR